ncbi:MAG TPA: hypothetical protein VJK54_11350, partial [Chthoniobacterales bacterium]|nr:hypothetical protein [Chthoniobacterales bacterium]
LKPLWWDLAVDCWEACYEMLHIPSIERLLMSKDGVEIFPLKSFRDTLIAYPTAERLLVSVDRVGGLSLLPPHWLYQGRGESPWGPDHAAIVRENQTTVRIVRDTLLEEIGSTLINIVFPNAEEMIREGAPLSSYCMAQILQKIAFVRYENPTFYAKRMTLVAQIAAKKTKDPTATVLGTRTPMERTGQIFHRFRPNENNTSRNPLIDPLRSVLNNTNRFYNYRDYAEQLHKTGQWIHSTLAADAAEELLLAVVVENRKKDIMEEPSADHIAAIANYVVALRTAAALRLVDKNPSSWYMTTQLNQAAIAADQILDRAAKEITSLLSITSLASSTDPGYVSEAQMEKASVALQSIDSAYEDLRKKTLDLLERRLFMLARDSDRSHSYSWEEALSSSPAAKELKSILWDYQRRDWTEEISSPRDLAWENITKVEKSVKAAYDNLTLERARSRIFHTAGGNPIRYDDINTVIESTCAIAEETQNAVKEAYRTIEAVNRAIQGDRGGGVRALDKTTLESITDATIRVAKEAVIEAKEAASFAKNAESSDNAAIAIVRAVAAQAVAKASLEALRVTMESFSREGEERAESERFAWEVAAERARQDHLRRTGVYPSHNVGYIT